MKENRRQIYDTLKKQEKSFVLPYYWNFYDSSDSITEPILSDTIILIKKM